MAGIIKSGQLQEGSRSAQVSAFNFEDMTVKADAYLETIRRQAAQILAQATQRAGEIEKEARQKGRQAALHDAEQAARSQLGKELQTLLPALNVAIESIRQARAAWLQHWEQNTIRLATAIAERVIRRELTRTPEISLDWVREALELVVDEGRMTVRLNPHDREILGEEVLRLTERLSRCTNTQIVSDPSVELGGCRVETEFGSIDQQVSAQLDRIQEELTGES